MAGIVNKNKIGIKSGGLHSRIAEGELLKSIAPEQADPNNLPNRIAIMIDCSGSMAGESIKLLEKALEDFIQKSNPNDDTAIAVESFPEQVRIELTNDKQKLWLLTMGLSASGGTPMTYAIEYSIKNYKMTRAIIISDGQPDYDPDNELLSQYKNGNIAIDTVHIGNSTSGEACLQRISEFTGGLFVKFKDIKSFASAFAFLLPETRNNAATLLLGSGANEVR